MHTIDGNQNVLPLRKHIDITPICYRSRETFYTGAPLHWTIFVKEATTIIRIGNIYKFKDKQFSLNNRRLIYKDIDIELPDATSISTTQRLQLSLGLSLSLDDDTTIDIQTTNFRTILHKLATMALKDFGIISNIFSEYKQYQYGETVFEVYLKAIIGKGTIPASNSYMRWLNEQDTLQLKGKLFTASNYQVGINAMQYTSTEFAENIFTSLFSLIKSIDFKHTEIILQPLDFIVPLNTLSNIRLRDTILLFSNCIGYNCGFIIRPTLEDKQYSRVYSIFTSIGSNTRKELEFINYDIGSALQTICLQLIDDVTLYPLHKELVDDKTAFRKKVMIETNQDMQWVKKELSKIDNLDEMPKKYKQIPRLEAYFYEAQLLRREIINNAEPLILSRAKDFAKTKYKKVWIESKDKPEFIEDGKKESSIFFFIWTQWERQIRESMMSCFANPQACHQVHDAVYSKEIIDVSIIEDKVLNDTAFIVKISTN